MAIAAIASKLSHLQAQTFGFVKIDSLSVSIFTAFSYYTGSCEDLGNACELTVDFRSKNLVSAGGGTLAFTALSIFAVHAEMLVHARPRMPELRQGYIYQFNLKHLVVYISAMDVNEQRLLLILSVVGAIVGIGVSSRIHVSASVNARVKLPSWIDEIKDKLWFEELAFFLAMSAFTALILLFGPAVCSLLLEYGIIILPPATS